MLTSLSVSMWSEPLGVDIDLPGAGALDLAQLPLSAPQAPDRSAANARLSLLRHGLRPQNQL